MKIVNRLMIFLHMFVGIGALVGGMMAILNPHSPFGITLKNSPFTSFLIPGIILFTILGIGNIISAIVVYYKPWFYGYVSSVFSWALVIWIIVQCIMLESVVALHVIFFSIGLVQAALAMLILFNQRLFPTNIVLYFYEKIFKSNKNGV